jgi:hypothetical protein
MLGMTVYHEFWFNVMILLGKLLAANQLVLTTLVEIQEDQIQ